MLKPKSAELFLTYECPHCKCDWQKTVREVQLLKGMICDNCNTYSKYEPIARVVVKPLYANEVSKVPTKKVVEQENPIKDDAIKALIAIGFQNREASNYVRSHEFETIEEYVVNSLKG